MDHLPLQVTNRQKKNTGMISVQRRFQQWLVLGLIVMIFSGKNLKNTAYFEKFQKQIDKIYIILHKCVKVAKMLQVLQNVAFLAKYYTLHQILQFL